MTESIAKTGFLTCLTSYITFWLLDAMRPGFVARYFSVHIFLIGVVGFGFWWSSVVKKYSDRRMLQWFISSILAIVMSVIIFQSTQNLGALGVFLALLSLFVPALFLRIIKQK